ncbi:MAG: SdpI family protein [Ruminococcaceae bacterium]|nr:SdpI family protein [Oscillospiraceae bacterium]
MGFWFFMLSTVLFIPAIMIICGRYFAKKAPDNINYLFGYRTNLSMKNEETWEFAHKYIGKIWYKWGWLLLMISIPLLLTAIDKDKDTIGTLGSIIITAQLVPVLFSIFLTEKALKQNFDSEGKKKDGKSEE